MKKMLQNFYVWIERTARKELLQLVLSYLPNIRKAKELLSNNYRIADIAVAVGYQDTVHFNRAFKEVTGTSPSAYKRNEG